jgi:hypothetical protein
MKYFEKISMSLDEMIDPALTQVEKKKLIAAINEMHQYGIGIQPNSNAPLIGALAGTAVLPILGTLGGYLVGKNIESKGIQKTIDEMNLELAKKGFIYSTAKRLYTKL